MYGDPNSKLAQMLSSKYPNIPSAEATFLAELKEHKADYASHKADNAAHNGFVGNSATPPTDFTDFNTLLTPGIYNRIMTSAEIANAPYTGSGNSRVIIIVRRSRSMYYQEVLYIDAANVNRQYFRSGEPGNWKAWQQKSTVDVYVKLWEGNVNATGEITLSSSASGIYDAFVIKSGMGNTITYYTNDAPDSKRPFINPNNGLCYATYSGMGQLQGVDQTGLKFNLTNTGGQPLRAIYGVKRGTWA